MKRVGLWRNRIDELEKFYKEGDEHGVRKVM